MCCSLKWKAGLGALLLCVASVVGLWGCARVERQRSVSSEQDKPEQKVRAKTEEADKAKDTAGDDHESALANADWMTPFKDQVPILFVNRSQNAAEWNALKAFWNETTEQAIDPRTAKPVTRKAVKIKVPLGLTSNPVIPFENPMTVAKWKLGKSLYFDKVLSSDNTVACATCHSPTKGFTDNARFSTGISGNVGGMSAPTVYNSAYHLAQFWDGRASSLEDQSQGPPQNPIEMFDGKGVPWGEAIKRLRKDDSYVAQFKAVFGSLPTRDAAAKAIATYERTVLSGNSIHDRAELAMRKRVTDEESNKFVLQAKDYATALKDAVATKDEVALKAMTLDVSSDAATLEGAAKSLHSGRELFFNKARCALCHSGDNFTDNIFHNLGVGVKDGKMTQAGRFGAQPTGHKNPEAFGAFKTPTLRHLVGTAPYMHDGGEKSLEDVVNFYDKGGNANEFLDVKMRDEDAERAWWLAKEEGKKYEGKVEVIVFNGKPIAPKKLDLTPQEKKDLVLFLRALQGDPADALVADPKKMP